MTLAAFCVLVALVGLGVGLYLRAHNGKLRNTEGPGWSAGPILSGVGNKSAGTVLDLSSGLPAFAIPQQPGSVHYITRAAEPLTGKKQIRLRYRVDMDPGAEIKALSDPSAPTDLCLYFQRKGDDWVGAGVYAFYRWYAGFCIRTPITAGEYEMVAPFDAAWGSVMGSDSATHPTEFAASLADPARIGFVLGGGGGFGHGIYATGPAKLTVLAFEVEP